MMCDDMMEIWLINYVIQQKDIINLLQRLISSQEVAQIPPQCISPLGTTQGSMYDIGYANGVNNMQGYVGGIEGGQPWFAREMEPPAFSLPSSESPPYTHAVLTHPTMAPNIPTPHVQVPSEGSFISETLKEQETRLRMIHDRENFYSGLDSGDMYNIEKASGGSHLHSEFFYLKTLKEQRAIIEEEVANSAQKYHESSTEATIPWERLPTLNQMKMKMMKIMPYAGMVCIPTTPKEAPKIVQEEREASKEDIEMDIPPPSPPRLVKSKEEPLDDPIDNQVLEHEDQDLLGINKFLEDGCYGAVEWISTNQFFSKDEGICQDEDTPQGELTVRLTCNSTAILALIDYKTKIAHSEADLQLTAIPALTNYKTKGYCHSDSGWSCFFYVLLQGQWFGQICPLGVACPDLHSPLERESSVCHLYLITGRCYFPGSCPLQSHPDAHPTSLCALCFGGSSQESLTTGVFNFDEELVEDSLNYARNDAFNREVECLNPTEVTNDEVDVCGGDSLALVIRSDPGSHWSPQNSDPSESGPISNTSRDGNKSSTRKFQTTRT
ncbi:hypothetical protein CCACVL1_05182 [Corchorus capsularis]|uniref:C3H1-type domain-containing protein n=1 Tax=Corchorus capsularis TaxID=210143 RepID=A0A1R3JM71_COCAP|nr:hypothetical protein CCACVL1_05182 [Corchorus capsularis]